jgi:hypothetical protein
MHIRTKFINYIISQNSYTSYLEIGLGDSINFNQIQILNKISVDVEHNPTYLMSSDNFFKNYNYTFDLIFIDGMHSFENSYRDLLNSLNALNDGGSIILHDTFPKKYEHQTPTPVEPCWVGEVWKTILKARINIKNISVKTFDLESGITLVQRTNNDIKLNLQEIYQYDYFKNNYTELLNLSSDPLFL